MYTVAEAANKLGLSAKTLRRWDDSGKLSPSRTLGGQRRYSVDDLQILDAIKNGLITTRADLLTPDQAANYLGVTSSTLAKYQEEGKVYPLVTASGLHYPKSRLQKQARSIAAPVIDTIPTLVSTSNPPIISRELKATIILTNTLITLVILLLYHLLSYL